MDIKIEDDIPIPKLRSNWAEDIKKLKPGQSFEVDGESISQARQAIAQLKKRNPALKNWKFTTRKTCQEPPKFRVWRVK